MRRPGGDLRGTHSSPSSADRDRGRACWQGSSPFCKMDYCPANMPGPDHDQQRRGKNGFHEDLHLAAAYTRVTSGWVGHVIGKSLNHAIFQDLQGGLDHTAFHLTTAHCADEGTI